jgi:hypothetical protein
MGPGQEVGVKQDFEEGRYNVYQGRKIPGSQPIGRIDDDEFVRTARNELIYRVDDGMFFDMKGNLIGEIDSGMEPDTWYVTSRSPSGITCLFTIEKE